MAYVSPSTRTTGTLITATIWNQDIVSNSQAGVPDLFTTAGDIVYATAADTATRLGIGANATQLQSNGSAPVWSNIAVPKATRKTAAESVTSSTTFQNDDHLLQAINANETWLVLYLLGLDSTMPGGFKTAITVPSGATLMASGLAFGGTNNGQAGLSTTSGGAIVAGGPVSLTTCMQYVWVNNSTTAGNIQLQWAQAVSNATPTTVLINSFQIAIRVA